MTDTGTPLTVIEATAKLRAAAVKAGMHIVVTNDYPDGVKAFDELCDAIHAMDAAVDAAARLAADPAGPDALVKALAYAIVRAPVPTSTDTAADVADRLVPLVIESGYLSLSAVERQPDRQP